MDETMTQELNRLEEFALALRHWAREIEFFSITELDHIAPALTTLKGDVEGVIERLREQVSEAV